MKLSERGICLQLEVNEGSPFAVQGFICLIVCPHWNFVRFKPEDIFEQASEIFSVFTRYFFPLRIYSFDYVLFFSFLDPFLLYPLGKTVSINCTGPGSLRASAALVQHAYPRCMLDGSLLFRFVGKDPNVACLFFRGDLYIVVAIIRLSFTVSIFY